MENEEKVPSSFSIDVVKRMMDDVEFTVFWKKYKSNRKKVGLRNRFDQEHTPLTDSESKFMYEYLNSENKSMPEIADQYGVKHKNVSSEVRKLALKILWLNKEKFEF